MKTRRFILIASCVTVLSLTACDLQDPVAVDSAQAAGMSSESKAASKAAAGRKPMILNLRGTATGELQTVPVNGVPTEANCFTVDLIDMEINRVVGEATDCLVVEPDETYPDGLEVIGTTIFDFGHGHSFTSQGLTSVQPKTHGSPDITHITGAIPSGNENAILEATGRFQKLEASVRLSGAVNMSRVMTDNEITFDCIFVVQPL